MEIELSQPKTMPERAKPIYRAEFQAHLDNIATSQNLEELRLNIHKIGEYLAGLVGRHDIETVDTFLQEEVKLVENIESIQTSHGLSPDDRLLLGEWSKYGIMTVGWAKVIENISATILTLAPTDSNSLIAYMDETMKRILSPATQVPERMLPSYMSEITAHLDNIKSSKTTDELTTNMSKISYYLAELVRRHGIQGINYLLMQTVSRSGRKQDGQFVLFKPFPGHLQSADFYATGDNALVVGDWSDHGLATAGWGMLVEAIAGKIITMNGNDIPDLLSHLDKSVSGIHEQTMLSLNMLYKKDDGKVYQLGCGDVQAIVCNGSTYVVEKRAMILGYELNTPNALRTNIVKLPVSKGDVVILLSDGLGDTILQKTDGTVVQLGDIFDALLEEVNKIARTSRKERDANAIGNFLAQLTTSDNEILIGGETYTVVEIVDDVTIVATSVR